MNPPRSDQPGQPQSLGADNVWREFLCALDRLPPDVRVAFLLHEIFEASYEEIAGLIGLPSDICRRNVESAREITLTYVHSRIGAAKESEP